MGSLLKKGLGAFFNAEADRKREAPPPKEEGPKGEEL